MRVEGWESRLDEYLRGIGPFEWGKSDCCMFSVGAVKAQPESITALGLITQPKQARPRC